MNLIAQQALAEALGKVLSASATKPEEVTASHQAVSHQPRVRIGRDNFQESANG